VEGTTPVLVLPVEMTAATVAVVEMEARGLLGEAGARLVVDLGTVTFMSSAGLGFLVRVGKLVSERGGHIALARPRGPVAKLLRAVGLEEVLPRFSSIDEAAGWLERPSS
jgi:anti-sigma B factor antagonist